MGNRKARKRLNPNLILFKGSAGILVEAKRRSLINAVHPLLLELRSSGYYIAENVITAAYQAVDE
jgi:predicted nucleic acid-binding protein